MNAPMPKPTVDELYANRPDTRPDMLWPVFGREGTIAWFTDYGAAVSFINANLGKRNLYLGEPDYLEVRA